MEWESTITLNFKNEVIDVALENMKQAIEDGDFDQRYGYKNPVSDDFIENIDDILDDEDYEDNSVEIDGVYNPYDSTKIMQNILTSMAKALPMEPFDCEIECSSTYDDAYIDAEYDGKNLKYHYTFEEIGWNQLECEECGYEYEIEPEDYHEDGTYECPECGAEIEHDGNYEEETLIIPIQ